MEPLSIPASSCSGSCRPGANPKLRVTSPSHVHCYLMVHLNLHVFSQWEEVRVQENIHGGSKDEHERTMRKLSSKKQKQVLITLNNFLLIKKQLFWHLLDYVHTSESICVCILCVKISL